MRAHEGFVVGGTDHDAIFIGQNRILWIIVVKGIAPHGWPQEITFEAEDEFKDFFVKLMVETTKLFFGPTRKGRSFIVDKNAPIFYFGFAERVTARPNVKCSFGFDRHIGPPIPWRNANLGGDIVGTEDRAAFVAAYDHQCLIDVRKWFVYSLYQKRLPLAA